MDFGKAPENWNKNVALISSISKKGEGPSMSIEGFAEVEAFLLYVEHFLYPISKCSQTIIVMHNLQVYKMRRGGR
jgi:hypothetical protein